MINSLLRDLSLLESEYSRHMLNNISVFRVMMVTDINCYIYIYIYFVLTRAPHEAVARTTVARISAALLNP